MRQVRSTDPRRSIQARLTRFGSVSKPCQLTYTSRSFSSFTARTTLDAFVLHGTGELLFHLLGNRIASAPYVDVLHPSRTFVPCSSRLCSDEWRVSAEVGSRHPLLAARAVQYPSAHTSRRPRQRGISSCSPGAQSSFHSSPTRPRPTPLKRLSSPLTTQVFDPSLHPI